MKKIIILSAVAIFSQTSHAGLTDFFKGTVSTTETARSCSPWSAEAEATATVILKAARVIDAKCASKRMVVDSNSVEKSEITLSADGDCVNASYTIRASCI